jgi:Skp family chaperone for outer membrane proteins
MKYRFQKNVKTVLITGISLVFLTGLCSWSYAESTLKIGTVDIKKVYDNWDVRLKASQEFEPEKKALEAKKDALDEAKNDYIKKSTMLKDDVKKEELAKIQKMDNDFQKEYAEVGAKLDKKSQELSAQLDTLLQKAYEDLSKKEGYTLIMDNRFVLYMGNGAGTDLTDKISDFVNKNSADKDEPKDTGKSSTPSTKSSK